MINRPRWQKEAVGSSKKLPEALLQRLLERGHALTGKARIEPAADIEGLHAVPIEILELATPIRAAIHAGIVPDDRRAIAQQLFQPVP